MTQLVYLGLGSNLGERRAYLEAAVRALPPAVHPVRLSAIYETPPWGYPDQGNFLNQVVEAETELAPLDLLAHLKAIEAKVGRQASFRNGPREIDIDILLYDDLVFNEQSLRIPHPRLHERAFMLLPLAELAPQLRHPNLNQSIQSLSEAADGEGIRRLSSTETVFEKPEDQ